MTDQMKRHSQVSTTGFNEQKILPPLIIDELQPSFFDQGADHFSSITNSQKNIGFQSGQIHGQDKLDKNQSVMSLMGANYAVYMRNNPIN